MTAIEAFAFDGSPEPPSAARPQRRRERPTYGASAKNFLRTGAALGWAFGISEVRLVNSCAGLEADAPIRVLVADDDSGVCALLERVLAAFGSVTTVHDAESALALLATQPLYDVIVSDFMLPGIDGLEFVERVRRDEKAAGVPILMISGDASEDVGERARAAGADAFLDKPFTLAQLRATVDALLGPRVRFVSPRVAG
jgi:CheY-like chemotaxis protein